MSLGCTALTQRRSLVRWHEVGHGGAGSRNEVSDLVIALERDHIVVLGRQNSGAMLVCCQPLVPLSPQGSVVRAGVEEATSRRRPAFAETKPAQRRASNSARSPGWDGAASR